MLDLPETKLGSGNNLQTVDWSNFTCRLAICLGSPPDGVSSRQMTGIEPPSIFDFGGRSASHTRTAEAAMASGGSSQEQVRELGFHLRIQGLGIRIEG